ncbi:hypothetical protein ACFFX0_16355 [Citricoccus parietis]|uniref:Uncharacterized protein n=1 Tax=Citricoccus parietis TaxID=592307 RepID=A0ABV5G178_9MICC
MRSVMFRVNRPLPRPDQARLHSIRGGCSIRGPRTDDGDSGG